jgi:hypothetical protein
MPSTLIIPRNVKLESRAGGLGSHCSAPPLLDVRDRATLVRWVRASTTPQRVVLRSQVVLLLADGLSAREVARRLGVSRHTVDLWRKRYLAEGCDCLLRDRPGRGRKRSSATTIAEAAICRPQSGILARSQKRWSSRPSNWLGHNEGLEQKP